jgi:catechol 2,3-dioxygenase-like lactoylglutathione lyase family enzyme
MIAVTDVQKSSAWYCEVLGATSGHGGTEYEQLLVDGELILQLHIVENDDHHDAIGDPDLPLGNGVAIWFEVDSFNATADRAKAAGVTVQTDVHVNPNANHQEIWLRDPDNYLVVLADSTTT